MADRVYDVAVVGARCAGSSLATYLARDGASVVVLEADALGTDKVISTHTIHPPGMDVLDELGVGAAVRQAAPPARKLRLQFDESRLDVTPPSGRDECCPRRERLDGLLQQAAAEAGADLHEHTRVTELIHAGERVAGVRAERNGRTSEFRARHVVGADGRHSTVAKLCRAEEYLGYQWPRGGYWAYWEPPATWASDRYPYDLLLKFVGDSRHLIFPTDHGQLLLGTMPPLGEARRWQTSDHKAAYLADLRADTEFTPLIDEGRARSVRSSARSASVSSFVDPQDRDGPSSAMRVITRTR